MQVYVGAYTEAGAGTGEGISVFGFDGGTGELTPIRTVTGVANPSFLALSADQRHLYAVEELEDGTVAAFARDPETGELTLLNREASRGDSPCHVSLDGSEGYALVANYGSGTVAALPVGPDGRLGPATSVLQHTGRGLDLDRQEGPHAHMIVPAPGSDLVLATDLGADRIFAYRLDGGTGRLEPNDRGPESAATAPGDGPRHLAFAPDGRSVYVINELASTLTVFAYDGESGALAARQTVPTLPERFAGASTCAHVVVSPDGRFVYGSNRGHDSIVIFAVDQSSGALTPAGHEPTRGRDPRNFAIDPSGAWLLAANQRSDTIVTFRRDAESGQLTAAGPVTRTGSPVAVVFAGA